MQLNMLYAFTCFMIIIHFLNMLIAIMGNTFAERTEVGAQIMMKDHLRFVMDNWLLKDFAFNLPKIKYIICAFNAEEEPESGVIEEVRDELVKMNAANT